jgi:hypothetical protein
MELLVREVSAARSPSSLLCGGCVFLSILLTVSIGVGSTLAAPRPDPNPDPATQPRNNAPKAVERLWSEYPLNPGPSVGSQAPAAGTAEPSPTVARDDAGGTRMLLLFTLAVTSCGLLAVGVLLLARGRVPTVAAALPAMRRLTLPEFAFARPSYLGLRIPRRPKGGQTMSYFRRLRGSGADDDSGTQNDDIDSFAKRFTRYAADTSNAKPPNHPREEKSDRSRPRRSESVAKAAQPPSARPDDPAAYEHLGEHVSSVLSSADEAAKRLQASAAKQADRIRGEAEEYARKTRAAADAYAEERREGAETEAFAITADADKRAREVRTSAEEQATDIQRDAVRRREALLRESERSEERLRNLLKVFRAMTERLESLVSTPGEASSTAVDEPDTSVDDELTEALVQSPGRSPRGPREPR